MNNYVLYIQISKYLMIFPEPLSLYQIITDGSEHQHAKKDIERGYTKNI